MEKLLCESCGATLVPDPAAACLTCEYCGTAVTNPHYDPARAPAVPDLGKLCVDTLLSMGRSENLASVDGNCFGEPIQQIYTARDAMGVPQQEKVYFLYDRTTLILGTLKEGFALADGGLYYKCDGQQGSRSWESFITGAVSCTDRTAAAEGRLCIGTSLQFAVTNEADSRLARFLIDYHNHVYQQYAGEAAPTAWTVTAGSADASIAQAEAPTLGRTLLNAAGSLLGGLSLTGALTGQSTPRRVITPRRTVHTGVMRRPTKVQPVHRPEPPRTPVQRTAPARPHPQQSATPRQGMRPQQHMQRNAPSGARGMHRPGGMRGPGQMVSQGGGRRRR